jgi:hypothetical protein
MDLGQFGMGNVGHLEGLEASKVVFWPNFKPYKELENFLKNVPQFWLIWKLFLSAVDWY